MSEADVYWYSFWAFTAACLVWGAIDLYHRRRK